MARVHPGRWTARIDGDFVVFLLGARMDPRHPLRSLGDLGGRRGMQHMLTYLLAHPEKGMLGYETAGLTFIQYWRSYEHLERFASDTEDPHLEAWRSYVHRVGSSGHTGIWHETYLVRAGEYDAIYCNMPATGLARAAEVVPVTDEASAGRSLRDLS